VSLFRTLARGGPVPTRSSQVACAYRGTSLIRKPLPLGPYSRAILGPYGGPRGVAISYEPCNPVCAGRCWKRWQPTSRRRSLSPSPSPETRREMLWGLLRMPARGSTAALKGHTAIGREECMSQLEAHNPIGFYRHDMKCAMRAVSIGESAVSRATARWSRELHPLDLLRAVRGETWRNTRPLHCRSTSSLKKRLPVTPYSRSMPRVLGCSKGGGRFLMSEVLL